MQKKQKDVTTAASEEKSGNEKRKFRLSDLWTNKRLRAITLSLAVVILAGITYLVLALTVLKPASQEELPTVGPHGETMVNGKPFVVEPITSSQITSIRVDNAFGGFYYYRVQGDDPDDVAFYFEGAENMLYDQTSDWMQSDYSDLTDLLASVSMIDGLYGISRYMLATTEVEGYDANNLAPYGLEGDGQAKLTVTYEDENGAEHTNVVRFGYQTVSGDSYYVMPEGRDALYVVADTTISRCIFTNLESYFTPLVALPVSSQEYGNVLELSIDKNEKPFFAMRMLSEEEMTDSGDLFTHILTYPNEYYPSAENMETVLNKFMNFSGTSVVAYNISIMDDEEDPARAREFVELMKKYSLVDENNHWYHTLRYKYQSTGETELYISRKIEVVGAEGMDPVYLYYVYSPSFDVIVEFKAEDLPWLEWDTLMFMDNHAFLTPIDTVSSITMAWGDTEARFDLTGTESDLVVTSPNVKDIHTDNFRQLYKAILFTTMEGEAEATDDGSLLLTLTIHLRNGDKHVYRYYGMTARKAYYTLDGSGEFYINRDYVKQMISACTGILNGETISVDRRD